jgi:hypothetical protein
MKVALVHDYLTQPGGAERVFELFCKRYPEADIFTSVYDPELPLDLGGSVRFTQLTSEYSGSNQSISDYWLPSISRLPLIGFWKTTI